MEGTRLLLLDAANEGLLLLFFFTFFFSSFFLWLTSPSVGLKTVGNDREIPQTVPAPVFFYRGRKRERNRRTGKRNRYYGISGTEHVGREHVDYDRESVTQDRNTIHVTTQNI